jgi:hypothetical protein
MLLTERRGSSNRPLVTMFSSPLPGINRVPELPEVPASSSVDGCGAPASRKAFNKQSLRSKQLAARGQTLTCAFHRSGIGGLDLFTTIGTGFDLLGAREVVGRAEPRPHSRAAAVVRFLLQVVRLAARGLE